MNNRFESSIQQVPNSKTKLVSNRVIKYPVRLKELTIKLIIETKFGGHRQVYTLNDIGEGRTYNRRFAASLQPAGFAGNKNEFVVRLSRKSF